jgi:hypothetical protein
MAMAKTKSSIFEDVFVTWMGKIDIFSRKSRKIIKRSSKIANSIFFYENRVFGGSFDNFFGRFLLVRLGEMGENSHIFSRKITERSSKNAK